MPNIVENVSAHIDRVFSAFTCSNTQRVPICEQSFASSVASKLLGRTAWTGSTDVHYAEACAWLDGESAHEEWVEQLYQDVIELHKTLDLDILFLPWRKTERPAKRVGEYEILYGEPDGAWTIYSFDPFSRTFGKSSSSKKGIDSDALALDLQAMLSNAEVSGEVECDPMLARAVREYGAEFAVSGASGMAIPMEPAWLELTVLERGLLAEYIDFCVEQQIASIEAQCRVGVRIINGGGDFAFNSGPIYSPKFFHEVMAPRWKRVFDRCRELGVYYIMRSDGNLWPVADDLFDWARPDAYYEVDYDAGMHFAEIRQRFPHLTLFGNVSSDLLLTGTSQEVCDRINECIDGGKPNIVTASANSVLHGTPLENVFALFDTAKTYKLA